MREIRVLPRGPCLSEEQGGVVEKVINGGALVYSLKKYFGMEPELLCSFVLDVLEGRGADQPGVLDDLNAMAANLSLLVDPEIRKGNPEAAKEVQLRVLEALAKKTEA